MGNVTRDNWIMLSVAAAVLAAAVGLVYVPQGKELNAVRTEVAAARMGLDADAAKASVVPEMMGNIQQMKARYKDFDRRMPQRKELAGFLTEITSILASENLSNQLTEPGSPTRGQFYHTLPIIMKFQGSYLALASLLERIDGMERLTRIQKLWITNDKKTNNLNIELQMNIYFTES